ncbi:MAG: hypothetical protein LBB23_00160 [Rickettsiales bacterium]|nr:hypothetical protein [Rickettsiales bacterium]
MTECVSRDDDNNKGRPTPSCFAVHPSPGGEFFTTTPALRATPSPAKGTLCDLFEGIGGAIGNLD